MNDSGPADRITAPRSLNKNTEAGTEPLVEAEHDTRRAADEQEPGARSGIAEVDRATADGRWEAAYARPARGHVPDDWQLRLRLNRRRRRCSDGSPARIATRFCVVSLRGGEAARDSCPQDRGVRGDARARRDGTSADAEEQRPTMIRDQRIVQSRGCSEVKRKIGSRATSSIRGGDQPAKKVAAPMLAKAMRRANRKDLARQAVRRAIRRSITAFEGWRWGARRSARRWSDGEWLWVTTAGEGTDTASSARARPDSCRTDPWDGRATRLEFVTLRQHGRIAVVEGVARRSTGGLH